MYNFLVAECHDHYGSIIPCSSDLHDCVVQSYSSCYSVDGDMLQRETAVSGSFAASSQALPIVCTVFALCVCM